MPTERITDAAVGAMAKGAIVWDSETRGFGVRYRAVDHIYVVKARIDGRQRYFTIGRHDPGNGGWTAARARKEAIRLLGLIRDGQDPAQVRDDDKAGPLFEVFAARYMLEYAAEHKKPRTIAEDKRLLKLHILPKIGRTKLAAIGKADIARFHSGMKATPVAANRSLALLSAIMGWAESVDERPQASNPCRHVKRFPEKERERRLTAPELARLGDALDRATQPWTAESRTEWRDECERQAEALDVPIAARAQWIEARLPARDTAEDWRAIAAFRLLLFTGARLSEILTLRWEWIDTGQGVARLPDSKTGAKNLYMAPGAMAVLAALPRFKSSPYVLPGHRAGTAFVGIQKPWQRVRALAGLRDVHIHDLRHAFASTAVASGDSLFIVGKLLGHKQSSTTERYAHLAPDPAMAVATRTAERLAAMMKGDSCGGG